MFEEPNVAINKYYKLINIFSDKKKNSYILDYVNIENENFEMDRIRKIFTAVTLLLIFRTITDRFV